MEDKRNIRGQIGWKARRRSRDIVEIKAIDFAVAINIGLEVSGANIVAGRRFAATIAQAIVIELLLMNAAANVAVGAINAAQRQSVCLGIVPPAALAPEIPSLFVFSSWLG
jgi:hypothetical protein